MNHLKDPLPLKLLKPEDVAMILRISVFTVKRYCRERTIPSYKIGNSIRIAEEDLQRFLQANLRTTKRQEEQAS